MSRLCQLERDKNSYSLLQTQRKRLKERLTRAQAEITELNVSLRSKESQLEGVKKLESEVASLRSENVRLQDKLSNLQVVFFWRSFVGECEVTSITQMIQDELRDTHVDYREELERLTKQGSVAALVQEDRADLEKKVAF